MRMREGRCAAAVRVLARPGAFLFLRRRVLKLAGGCGAETGPLVAVSRAIQVSAVASRYHDLEFIDGFACIGALHAGPRPSDGLLHLVEGLLQALALAEVIVSISEEVFLMVQIRGTLAWLTS
jgi:hypothetical protein